MGGLEAVQVRLMDSDSLLELLDVLGAALAESSLGLSVPLLALLGGGVYLSGKCQRLFARHSVSSWCYILACGLPCAWAARCVPGWAVRRRPRV